MPDGGGGMDDEAWDEAASATSSASRAPSLHPSIAGTAVSVACSEDTIGAGDDTEYWDFQHRTVTAKDLGHTCRECRLPFTNIGDPLTERRGALGPHTALSQKKKIGRAVEGAHRGLPCGPSACYYNTNI